MSLVLNGVPSPRIVLYKSAVEVDDFTLACFDGGKDAPEYINFEPEFLRHELDPDETQGEIDSLLRGFRMRVQVHYTMVSGDELQKLRKFLDRRVYDTAYIYPWSTDKPNYCEQVTIDDDTIKLIYKAVMFHEEFDLKIMSARLVDYVTLEDADFLSWGNITLQFTDLTMLFNTLT